MLMYTAGQLQPDFSIISFRRVKLKTPLHTSNTAALSVNEFCHQAGIGRTKLYQEIASGRLKALKCGRRTIIPLTEFENWLGRLPEIGEIQ
jgi:excisionase family DNA binding protein